MQQNRSPDRSVPLDEEIYEIESRDVDPEALLLQSSDDKMVRQALEDLRVEFREVLVLREIEELPCREIARVTDLPMGTVMSRPARGRKRLQLALTNHKYAEVLS